MKSTINLERFNWERVQLGDLISDVDLLDVWLLTKRTESNITLLRLRDLESFSFEEYETKHWKRTVIVLDARPEAATITFGETK